MLVKGDYENLEPGEIRKFKYDLLRAELGDFERYKKFDGWECEEVSTFEVIDGEKVCEFGWQIIGTNKIVEYQWTTPSK